MTDGDQTNDNGVEDNVIMHPKLSDQAEIRRKVQERKKTEHEQYGRGGSDGDDDLPSDFVRSCLRTNQLGDGEMFKALHRGKFLYCKSMKTWLVWTGHHWDIDHIGAAEAAVEDVAVAYEKEAAKVQEKMTDKDSRRSYKNMLESLEKRSAQLRGDYRRQACLKFAHTSVDSLAIEGSELDNKPWILACKNGVIELKTGKFRDGRPDDYLLKASPTEWKGIDAPRENWIKSYTEIMAGDEDMVAFQQRLFGMAAVGKVVEKVFPVLTGPGGDNGKTTVLETISTVMGPLAGPIPSDMLVAGWRQNSSGPSPDIMSLKGLRIAYASETEDGSKVSAARVKLMTGKDKLTGRWPNDKFPITFDPCHTLFLLSNFKPRADAQDQAFWSRMINIPFTVRFLRNRKPKNENELTADPHLDEKLQEEASGILAWIVEGCLMWQRNGLQIPVKVQKEGEDYQTGEDDIGAFVEYCCVIGSETELKVGASELYDIFFQWWKRYVGKFPPKQKKFGTYLNSRFHREKEGGIFKYYGIGVNWGAVNEFIVD